VGCPWICWGPLGFVDVGVGVWWWGDIDVRQDLATKDLLPKLGEPIIPEQIAEWCGGV